MPLDPVDLDGFVRLGKALGLRVPQSEQRDLFEGLKGLNAMIALLPEERTSRDIPATLFDPMSADGASR